MKKSNKNPKGATNSLGATPKKKATSKKNVLSIMQSPCPVNWPVIKNQEAITELLTKLLVPVQRKSIKMSWSLIKNMTPEERKQARDKSREDMDEGKLLRRELHYGMNSFMHGMEHRDVSSALISGDLQPKFFLNNLVQLAAIHEIPVIIIHGLRDLTKNTLGFSSSALAVKKMTSENENSYFYPLHKIIVDLAREYNFPKLDALFHVPLKESKSASDQSVSDLQQQDKYKSSESCLPVPHLRSSKNRAWKYSISSERQARFLNKNKCKKISKMPNDKKPVLLEEVTSGDDSSVDMEITVKLPQMELKETNYTAKTSKSVRHPYLRTFLSCHQKIHKRRKITEHKSVHQEDLSKNCDEEVEMD